MSIFSELDGIREQALHDLTTMIETQYQHADITRDAIRTEINCILTEVIMQAALIISKG